MNPSYTRAGILKNLVNDSKVALTYAHDNQLLDVILTFSLQVKN